MLITLAIIGVVAALTIPTLIVSNQEKGWNTAATVFERRLEESLKIMNTQGNLAGYKTTRAFVDELSKHLKIIKVCNNSELISCFADKITWEIINISNPENEVEIIDVNSIKTAEDLGHSEWNTEAVGFQLNNGTSGLIAYDPNCKQDPYSNQITGKSCIAVIYDTSGMSKPNTYSKDVRGINSMLKNCAFKSNSACFGAPFEPEAGTLSECKKILGEENCHYDRDYLVGAIKQCGSIDNIVTMTQLAEIANYIYHRTDIVQWPDRHELTRDDDNAARLGLPVSKNNFISIMSGEIYDNREIYHRYYGPDYTNTGHGGRLHSGRFTVCTY